MAEKIRILLTEEEVNKKIQEILCFRKTLCLKKNTAYDIHHKEQCNGNHEKERITIQFTSFFFHDTAPFPAPAENFAFRRRISFPSSGDCKDTDDRNND